jgi:hypothetical protein
MVILETIAVGAVIYGIHKNRKYKKMKRMAEGNQVNLVPEITTKTTISPGSNQNTLNVQQAPQSTSPRSPMSHFDDINLININIKDDFGRVLTTATSGTLTFSEGGYQALTIYGMSSKDLLEGRQYTIDAYSNKGQQYQSMRFYYYGLFDGGLFFSAVSPHQATNAVKSQQPQVPYPSMGEPQAPSTYIRRHM